VAIPRGDAVPHRRAPRRSYEGYQGLYRRELKRIKITKKGVSPRIVKAKVIGSGGKTTVRGADLRTALGLRSTWAKFKKVRR